MKKETFEEMKKSDSGFISYKRAVSFIEKLMEFKIPLSSIDTNDWHCNLSPKIYLTIPYGMINGGKYKTFHFTRLGNEAIKRAIQFYFSFKMK